MVKMKGSLVKRVLIMGVGMATGQYDLFVINLVRRVFTLLPLSGVFVCNVHVSSSNALFSNYSCQRWYIFVWNVCCGSSGAVVAETALSIETVGVVCVGLCRYPGYHVRPGRREKGRPLLVLISHSVSSVSLISFILRSFLGSWAIFLAARTLGAL